jgi:hypothetical protein
VQLPGDDPDRGYRKDLPSLPSDRRPHGYQPGLQLEERLQGLGVVLLGVIGMLVVYAMYSGLLPLGLPPPPQPPGLVVPVPTPNPAACILPLMALSSIGLVIVGFRRVLDP